MVCRGREAGSRLVTSGRGIKRVSVTSTNGTQVLTASEGGYGYREKQNLQEPCRVGMSVRAHGFQHIAR